MLILFKINRKETRTRSWKQNADNDVKTLFSPESTINLLENLPSVVEHEEQKNKKNPQVSAACTFYIQTFTRTTSISARRFPPKCHIPHPVPVRGVL